MALFDESAMYSVVEEMATPCGKLKTALVPTALTKPQPSAAPHGWPASVVTAAALMSMARTELVCASAR